MPAFDSPTGNALGTNCMEHWWKPNGQISASIQFGGSSIYEPRTFHYIEIADFDYVLVWQENTAFDCILNIITKKEYPNPPTMLPTPWVYQRPFFQANGNLFGKLQVRLLHWRFGDFSMSDFFDVQTMGFNLRQTTVTVTVAVDDWNTSIV